MPEGDTIWQTAQTLRGVFAGRTILSARSSLPDVEIAIRKTRLEGQSIQDVLLRVPWLPERAPVLPRA